MGGERRIRAEHAPERVIGDILSLVLLVAGVVWAVTLTVGWRRGG